MDVRSLWSRVARRLSVLLAGGELEHMKRTGLTVGRNLSLQTGVILDPNHYWHITIGDDVTMAPHVHVLAHDASTKQALGYTRIGKVRIGSRVFLGAGTIVLPGVTIGDDVIVGAGSVVSRDIPPGSVAVGSPAKVVTSTEAFLARRREELERSPKFGAERFASWRIDAAGKAEMAERMGERVGYVE